MTRSRFLLLLSVLLATAAPAWAQARTIEGTPYVIDGDTLDIQGQRVRLYGINAPESKQSCGSTGEQWACGQAATQALRQLVGSRAVSCVVRDSDAYGRSVSTCTNARGEDLSAAMVRQGMANAYRRYSTDYVGLEAQAQSQGVGVWSGDYQDPEAYRHGGVVAGASGSPTLMGSLKGLFTGRTRTSSNTGLEVLGGFVGQADSTGDAVGAGYVPLEDENTADPRALASDNYRDVGRRTPGVGGLSGAQFCALAALAHRPCR